MSTTAARERFPWARFLEEHGIQSEWMAPKAAMDYLNVVKSTLLVWSQKQCPFLGGRCLKTKRFPVYRNRFVDCYSKPDLEEIRQARFSLPTPTNSRNGDGWITKEEAAKIMGWGARYLRRVLQKGSSFLNRGISTRRVRGLRASKQTTEITQVSRNDIEELVRNRDACVIPEGRIPIREAAEKLGLASTKVLHQWLLNGCPHLDGRKLDVTQGNEIHDGRVQRTNLLLKSEVEEIRKKLKRAPFEPFANAHGKWWPIDLAVKRFANARRGLLYLHKNKPCPQLGCRKLRATQFRRMVPGTYRHSRVWGFPEDDLRDLLPPQPGGRRRIPPSDVSKEKPMVNAEPAQAKPESRDPQQHKPSTKRNPWRPVVTDPDADERIFDAWKTGQHKNKADLARNLGKDEQEVRAALDRHRMRVNRGQR